MTILRVLQRSPPPPWRSCVRDRADSHRAGKLDREEQIPQPIVGSPIIAQQERQEEVEDVPVASVHAVSVLNGNTDQHPEGAGSGEPGRRKIMAVSADIQPRHPEDHPDDDEAVFPIRAGNLAPATFETPPENFRDEDGDHPAHLPEGGGTQEAETGPPSRM